MKKHVITGLNNLIYSFVFENDRLVLIEPYDEAEESILGNVYVGKVQNIVKNINSAFVEIGKDKVCFYSLNENENHRFLNVKNNNRLCQDDLILVQVSREAIKTKAPSLTSDISFNGTFVVLSLDGKNQVAVSSKIKDDEYKKSIREALVPLVKGKGYSIVVRTAAYEVSVDTVYKEACEWTKIADDIILKSNCRPKFTCLYKKEPQYINDIKEAKLGSEDVVITDIAELYEEISNSLFYKEGNFKLDFYGDKLLPLYKLYNLEKLLNDALRKQVWLKSGAYLVIEPTEALTVIDVNTGKFDGNKKNREDTFLKINIEATNEIARQLRIRNISGIIIIDFINMEAKEHKEELITHLRHVLAMDPVPTFFIEMTKLDLVQITRKKIKRPLYEYRIEMTKNE